MACCCCTIGLVRLFIAILYPLKQTYSSYQLKEKQSLWINFWIIISLLTVVESITFDILYMIPLYELFKTLFIVWLYHEQFQGALLIGTMISPIYKQIGLLIAPFNEKLEVIDNIKN